MEQRLSIITLGVEDVAASTAFYERLGWKRSTKAGGDEISFFQLGGIILSLYNRTALAQDANLSSDGEGFGGIALSHNGRTTDEVDALLVEAEKAGAKILKPAEKTFWGGYSGCFADLDGHVWEIAWNPFFAIDKDGNIKLPS